MGDLKNCWEIEGCGRECGGKNVEELGECIASIEGFGHSCWALAGTLCEGEVQGTEAQKIGNCMNCEVYKLYHRSTGTKKKEILSKMKEENSKYNKFLMNKLKI